MTMKHHTDFSDILQENERRKAASRVRYDQLTGEGCCGPRRRVAVDFGNGHVPELYLPESMIEASAALRSALRGSGGGPVPNPLGSADEFDRLRIAHDFEYWCRTCVTITLKGVGREGPLVLNAPQRRLAAELERQRLAGLPVRVVLLKARQWGGSTLVQMYMAWMQLVVRTHWNSVICGHLRGTSAAIKGMYTRVLRNYPQRFLPEGHKPEFKRFEGSANAHLITGRDCLVITGSAVTQEMVHGYDVSMAHLSEVAFWPDTDRHSPGDVMRSICGTVPLVAGTLIVLESTANGVGSYFHSLWLNACAGRGGYAPVFVPWHEIDGYSVDVADPLALWKSLDDYERRLWHMGCTLEQIAWYRAKRGEYATHDQMMAEFPSNDIEAFAVTGRNVFAQADVEALRQGCRAPSFTGDIAAADGRLAGIALHPDPHGALQVWQMPHKAAVRNRYVVAVDVGGRSLKADYSVIAVLDRGDDPACCVPEVVAQWRGHTDHDLLAWKAAQMARFYCNALLVIESNTLETASSEGDGSRYIMHVIGRHYGNLYCRRRGVPGFQTNVRTKQQVIYGLIAAVRDRRIVERDHEALNELNCYELKPNGSYGAMRGRHDDVLMTRAIGIHFVERLNARSQCTVPQAELDAMTAAAAVAVGRKPAKGQLSITDFM